MRLIPAIVLAAAVCLAFPLGMAATFPSEAEEPSEWGRCTAWEASAQGNESSDGVVHATPPFEGLNESVCENATAPWDGTPAEDHIPEDLPGEDDNPGDDQPPEDPPDDDDNPGDERP